MATSANDAMSFSTLYSSNLNAIALDLAIPGVDGVELIRFLGDNRSPAALILMSGFGEGILHSAKELATGHGLRVVGRLEPSFRSRVRRGSGVLRLPTNASRRRLVLVAELEVMASISDTLVLEE